MARELPVTATAQSADSCCTPLVAAPLSVGQAADLAERLKGIADPTRLRLLSLMLAMPGLEACTCDLTEPLGLTQPTVTHHLKRLAAAGLVVADRKVGNFTYYKVEPDALRGLAELLTPA